MTKTQKSPTKTLKWRTVTTFDTTMSGLDLLPEVQEELNQRLADGQPLSPSLAQALVWASIRNGTKEENRSSVFTVLALEDD